MNKFQRGYISGELLIAISIVAIVLAISVPAYLINTSTDKSIVEAIKAGADPLAAKCALTNTGDRAECIVAAVKGKQ